jgi:hypothetical protein
MRGDEGGGGQEKCTQHYGGESWRKQTTRYTVRTLFKWIFKNDDGGLQINVVGYCEHGDEHSGFIKRGKSTDLLRNYQLL